MKKVIVLLLLLCFAVCKVSAAELDFIAPTVPEIGKEFLTEEPENFRSGLHMILKSALRYIHPAFTEAASICIRVIGVLILLSITENFADVSKNIVRLISTLSLSVCFLSTTKAMIPMGESTIHNLTSYGRLLLPVMTGALAAQGHAATSGALYMGTAFCDALLSTVIERFMLPAVYAFYALSVAARALGEASIGKMKDSLKSSMVWILKIILSVFTGYMTISGAVSGSTDALAMKAAKLTISGMVPVVGGILSDASEAVLVSSAVMKNAAGIYGILAIIAIAIGPFIRLGIQYLLVKLTACIAAVFARKEICDLIQDFASAMGLVLAMTAAVSLMLLISTVCFMKVVT